MAKRRCAICTQKKDLHAFPETLRLMGIDGTYAHPKCVVIEQNKRAKKAMKQGLLVRRIK